MSDEKPTTTPPADTGSPTEPTPEPILDPDTSPPDAEPASGSLPEKKSLWQRAKETGKNVQESFKRADKVELTKTVAKTGLGVVASIGGFKSLHDLPVYVWQKIGTEREKNKLYKNLKEAYFQNKYEEDDETNPTETTLDKKRFRLEQAINTSTSLTPEKKAELVVKMEKIMNETKESLTARKTHLGSEIGKLLDEYIETRVKGMTVIKETINTALTASGLLLARGVAYGALSLVERYKKVSKEKETGERNEGLAKELIVNGFKETWRNLKGEKGKMETVKAWGVVFRFAGIFGLSLNEFLNEDATEKFNTMIESVQKHGFVEHAKENLLQGLDKSTLGIFTSQEESSAPDTSAHVDDQPPATDTDTAPENTIHPEMEAPPSGAVQEGAQLKANPEKLTKALDEIRAYNQDLENKGEVPKGFTEKQELLLRTNPELLQKTNPEIFEQSTETVSQENLPNPKMEVIKAQLLAEEQAGGKVHSLDNPSSLEKDLFTKKELDLGTVRQGDGLIRIAQRQLEADPERFGFQGDLNNEKEVAHWVRKTAFSAVTKAGLANQDGWVGLGGKGIDKMAVTLSNGKDGIDFNFVDAQSGEPMDPATLQKEHFTYDYQKPAEAPLAETLKDVLPEEKPIDVGTTSDHDKDISFRSDISEQEKTRLTEEIRAREADYAKTKVLLEEVKTKYAGKPELPSLVADVEKRLEGIRLLEQDARDIASGTVPEGGLEVGGEGATHDSPDTETRFYGAPGSEPAEPAGPNVEPVPDATPPLPTPERSPDVVQGITFKGDYSQDQKDRIVQFVEMQKLEREELHKLLENSRGKFGSNPNFKQFEEQINKTIQNNSSETNQVITEVGGGGESKSTIRIDSLHVNPEEAAKLKAQGKIDVLISRFHLSNTIDNASGGFDELDQDSAKHPGPSTAESMRIIEAQIPAPLEQFTSIHVQSGNMKFEHNLDGTVKGVDDQSLKIKEITRTRIEGEIGLTREQIDAAARTYAATYAPGEGEKISAAETARYDQFIRRHAVLQAMKTEHGTSKEYQFLLNENKKLAQQYASSIQGFKENREISNVYELK